MLYVDTYQTVFTSNIARCQLVLPTSLSGSTDYIAISFSLVQPINIAFGPYLLPNIRIRADVTVTSRYIAALTGHLFQLLGTLPVMHHTCCDTIQQV